MPLRRIALRTLKVLFWALAGLLALLAVLTLVTARPADKSLYPPAAEAPKVTVYVKYSWLHANIALPTGALLEHAPNTALAMQSVEMEAAPWTAIGWGDLWYYRERGKTQRRLHDFARSMLRPDNPSVIFIEPLAEAPTPETTGRDVVRLELSEAGFRQLARRLDISFLMEEDRPVLRGRGRAPGSWFFASHEGSDITQVCNHWIGHLLNAAGVPVTPVTDTMTFGMDRSLRWRAGAERVPGDRASHIPPAETPPAHSGVYDAASPSAQAISPHVRFETYSLRFGSAYSYETAPLMLAEARDIAGTEAETSLAALMEVAPESLIELREVTSAMPSGAGEMLCGEAPARYLVTGFREAPGQPFEIVLAAFRGEAPPSSAPLPPDALCSVYHYRQR